MVKQSNTKKAAVPGARLHPTLQLARGLDAQGVQRLMLTALHEIAGAGHGLDLWFHRFDFEGRPLALACRWVQSSLWLEIEIGECSSGLPRVTLLAPDRPARAVRGVTR